MQKDLNSLGAFLVSLGRHWHSFAVAVILIVGMIALSLITGMPVSWGFINLIFAAALFVACYFTWSEERSRSIVAVDQSKPKLIGEITEFHPDAPFVPEGADYALVVKIYVVSSTPVKIGIRDYRLETICDGVPYKSTTLFTPSRWAILGEKKVMGPDNVLIVQSQRTPLDDFRTNIGNQPLPQGVGQSGWLAFLFHGMFKRLAEWKTPDCFDPSRTVLVLTDAYGGEHRLTIKPNTQTSGKIVLADS
jgi:hypothetical protein